MDTSNFWGWMWLFFWGFAFVTYLIAFVAVLIDIFQDEKLNGWLKAVWIIFLIFVPFITILIYVIARGAGMAERRARDRDYVVAEPAEDYPRSGPSANPAADIDQAKQLLDRGVITAGEFDALKAKALGNKY